MAHFEIKAILNDIDSAENRCLEKGASLEAQGIEVDNYYRLSNNIVIKYRYWPDELKEGRAISTDPVTGEAMPPIENDQTAKQHSNFIFEKSSGLILQRQKIITQQSDLAVFYTKSAEQAEMVRDFLSEGAPIDVTVKKSRKIYWLANQFAFPVRVHLDSLESYGDFIEFEVKADKKTDLEQIEGVVISLLDQFNISKSDVTSDSYRDIVRRGNDKDKEVTLFNTLPEATLREINAIETETIEVGEQFISEGDNDKTGYFIEDGEVIVSYSGQEIRRLRRNDTVGEYAYTAGARTADVTVSKRARVKRLNTELLSALYNDPTFLAYIHQRQTNDTVVRNQQIKQLGL